MSAKPDEIAELTTKIAALEVRIAALERDALTDARGSWRISIPLTTTNPVEPFDPIWVNT